MTYGKPGTIHGMYTYLLQDDNGDPLPVHSIASGLDYPGVGPQHSYLHDSGRVRYEKATDKETVRAFTTLCRKEGIIPALESSHAVAYAMRYAAKLSPDKVVVINLSGRGDKDIDYIAKEYGLDIK